MKNVSFTVLVTMLTLLARNIVSFPHVKNGLNTTNDNPKSNKLQISSQTLGYITLITGPVVFILVLLFIRYINRKVQDCRRKQNRGLSKVKSVFDFSVTDIDGNVVNMSKYEGSVCLLVNVGASCGNKNVDYKELAELHSKYKDDGLRILVFICDPFGNQYNAKKIKIKPFIEKHWGIEFDMFEKLNGHHNKHTAPLFTYLNIKSKKSFDWILGIFSVNCNTYIVNKNGKPISRFASWPKSTRRIEAKCVEALKDV